VLAVVAAVNSVIALFYYAAIARRMWAEDVPDGDLSPVSVTPSLVSALTLCGIVTLAFGVAPQAVARFTNVSLLALGG
jgi:NADH:ubiquinone oxidoreductase subunit 2 (subunit N)